MREEDEISQELLDLRYRIAGDRVLAAGRRFLRLLEKANFNPNQPRAPRGRPEGGQWTRVGTGSG